VSEPWRDARTRVERWPEIAPYFSEAMASRTRHDWFADAAERGLIFGPVQNLHEVLASEQYAAREYFTKVELDGRLVDCPGLPFKWDISPGARRPTARGAVIGGDVAR
jgi:crotonobetainyl-CoA:carnitine CoA-transferase CaiB-like acyl-CoA transferase